ncbi:hypothetical protein J3U16_11785, partial [Gilliamella sp. B3023]|uniref:hypothetical protein n=1 Tax=Gilliamella sp. B3023 TaxID=2817987 RepID=UPI00226A2BDA
FSLKLIFPRNQVKFCEFSRDRFRDPLLDSFSDRFPDPVSDQVFDPFPNYPGRLFFSWLFFFLFRVTH